MITSLFFTISLLFLSSILNAVIFYFLVNRLINIRQCYKLTCVAAALNKLFFTGTGFLISSYFSRREDIPFYQALSAFVLLEFFSVSLWLILGIYFGTQIAMEIPVIIAFVFILGIIAVWLRKDKFIGRMTDVLTYWKAMWQRAVLVIPIVIVNMAVFILYYYFLFRYFGFVPGIAAIIKIVAVCFTVSYLSPAPTGLGFKETGLIFLLMQKGVVFNNAVTIAIIDRVVMTVFFAILGIIMGFDLIKEQIGRRFKEGRKKLSVL